MNDEKPVIDAIDALIDESMAGGEDYSDDYDTCEQCHHQWHGLRCLYMSGGSNPCRCTSNVQSEQSTKSSDDVGVRPRWIGGPAGNGGASIVTVHGYRSAWHDRRDINFAITMPNGDTVTMSGHDYHDVLQRARQVIASIYEVMNTLMGMDICESPQTDADVESILFADVPQRLLLGDNGLWIPDGPAYTVRHLDGCPIDGECHCGRFAIEPVQMCDESHCYCANPNQCRWHQ